MAQLRSLVDHGPLVTVRGPVGVGKTRLVLEWAAEQDAAAAPIAIVELERVGHAGLLASTIAAAVGVAEDPASDPADRLIDQLHDSALTLILDGCDQLLDDVRTLVGHLLANCPTMRVVCTSASPIGLPDEAQLALRGLPAGDGASLFIDRARAVRPDLRSTGPDRAIVRSIVEALDGIPFALELAAARVRASSLAEILAGVVSGLDSFQEPSSAKPERQTSLHAALDWTLSQLSAPHRRTLLELCALPGPFTRQAAAAISTTAGEDLEVALDDLIALGLLRADSTPGRTVFVATANTRQHLVRTAHEPRTSAPHRMVTHYSRFAQQVDGGLRGPQQISWLRAADVEIENLRHSIILAADLGDAAAQRAAGALGRYWDWRGLIAQANDAYSHVLRPEHDVDADPEARVMVRIWAGFFAWEGGELSRAGRWVEAAVEIATREHMSWPLAVALCMRGLVVSSCGSAAAAAADFRHALGIASRTDDPWWLAWISTALARCELQLGDDIAAARRARFALDTFRRVGDQRAQGWALAARAEILSKRGRYADAHAAARDAALLANRVEDPRTVAAALEVEVGNLYSTGRFERATEAAARLDAMQLARGLPLRRTKAPSTLDRLLDLEDRLGHERFAAAWARGSVADVLQLLRSC